jgi:hypothetical protein
MSKADIAFIEQKLVPLPARLTELKKLKKTVDVRLQITNLIARIQRLKRWIKELKEDELKKA